MFDNLKKEMWLIGAGGMAIEYTKILSSMGIIPTVIGRRKASAQGFTKTTGIEVFCGGINAFLETKPKKPFPNWDVITLCEGSRTTNCLVKDIKAGEAFTPDNIRSVRPGHGLPPKFYDEVLGKRATCDIKKGTPVLRKN